MDIEDLIDEVETELDDSAATGCPSSVAFLGEVLRDLGVAAGFRSKAIQNRLDGKIQDALQQEGLSETFIKSARERFEDDT